MAPEINWGHFCMWTIPVPISLPLTQKKQFHLNLNVYRNANFRTLAKMKVDFAEIVKPRISHLPKMAQVHLVYTLFPGSRRSRDTANVCCIVDKFFSDCLVSAEIIEDDNYTVVLSVEFRYGEIDKSNPRVEVAISQTKLDVLPVSPTSEPANNYNKRKTQMKLSINQNDIEDAVRTAVAAKVTVADDQEIDVLLRATRGPEGFIADVEIGPKGSTIKDRPAPKVRQKPGPKPKAKAEPIATKVGKGKAATPSTTAPVVPAEPESQVDPQEFNEDGPITDESEVSTAETLSEPDAAPVEEAPVTEAQDEAAAVAAEEVVEEALEATPEEAPVEAPAEEVQPEAPAEVEPEAEQPTEQPVEAQPSEQPSESVVDAIAADDAAATDTEPTEKPKSLFGNVSG